MNRLRLTYFLMLSLLFFIPQVSLSQANMGESDAKAQADSLNKIGADYLQKDDLPNAESYFQKAVSFCRKKGLDEELGTSLYNLSVLYTDTANYEAAIEFGEESLKILKKYKDKMLVVKCLMNLEICKKEHGRFLEAMSCADEAVEILRTLKDDKLLELALWRQGDLWNHWNTYRAIPMFKEALALAMKIPEYHNLDNIYGSLGFCYKDPFGGEPDYKMAEYYFKKGLDAALQYDPKEVPINRIYYGKICTGNEKYDEAAYHLKIVYAEAKASNNREMLSTAAFCMAELCFYTKDFKKAYDYLREHETLEEAYSQEQKKGTQDKMAFNFKTGRIEAANKLLKQQIQLQEAKQEQESFQKNVKIGISVTVILFLLVVTVLLSKFLKKKNLLISKKSDTLRQQVLLTQMSPRFITSSISTIQGLIKKDKPDLAATYLSKFAKLTRQILENSTGQLISLDEEIAMITNYLTVQRLLYGEGFEFTINDNGIDTEAIFIPPMLTQPLLANSVQRVMSISGRDRSITVTFGTKHSRLSVEVRDNGAFLKEGEKQAILASTDMKITAERLGKAWPIYGDPVRITDNTIGGGVSAYFEVEYVED